MQYNSSVVHGGTGTALFCCSDMKQCAMCGVAAGEILLEMRWQEECPELKIVLVYPFPGHDERWDPKSRERLHRLKENCDQFVMGSRGVGAQGYKERTVYMVQCADCLVAVYNNDPQGAGSIRVAMRIAKTRRLPLVLIHPNTGKISRIG